jgi:hypothetical protein
LAAIFDIAKSAWLSDAPAEFTRMKISVTVSMSRSSASSMIPTWLLVIAFSRSIRRESSSPPIFGLAWAYAPTIPNRLAPGRKTSAMSGI